MAKLKVNMTHDEAAEHLRGEVVGTSRHETAPLVRIPAFFGAVRAIMSDIDYVAALHEGWDGRDRRQIATARKAVDFLKTVFPAATGNQQYAVLANHLYDLFRHGTVHLRAPKFVVNRASSTSILSWGLMEARMEDFDDGLGTRFTGTHMQPVRATAQKTVLPVSIQVLFEDFLSSCEYFANGLETEARVSGDAQISKWRQTADALASAEPTALLW
jgi:hypothetical protein